MTSPTNELARALVRAMGGARMVTCPAGQVCCANAGALDLLSLEEKPSSILDALADARPLRRALKLARRGTSAIPVSVTSNHGRRLRANIKALPTTPGKPASWLLVSLETRSHANRKMLSLTRQLTEIRRERSRLQDQNLRLKATVERTIPHLTTLSFTDPLTGLKNRRYFDKHMAREWKRALRTSTPLSLLLVDVDHFKAYNDSLGHPEGDRCLKTIADALLGSVGREFDKTCRIGGEEFALILPSTDAAGASTVGERLRLGVRSLRLEHPGQQCGIVTVSVGAGTCVPASLDHEPLVAAVDRALYRAKELGRDRLEVVDTGWPDAATAETRLQT